MLKSFIAPSNLDDHPQVKELRRKIQENSEIDPRLTTDVLKLAVSKKNMPLLIEVITSCKNFYFSSLFDDIGNFELKEVLEIAKHLNARNKGELLRHACRQDKLQWVKALSETFYSEIDENYFFYSVNDSCSRNKIEILKQLLTSCKKQKISERIVSLPTQVAREGKFDIFKIFMEFIGQALNNDQKNEIINAITGSFNSADDNMSNHLMIIDLLLSDPKTNISYETKVSSLLSASNTSLFRGLLERFGSEITVLDRERILIKQAEKLQLNNVKQLLDWDVSTFSTESKKQANRAAANNKYSDNDKVKELLNLTGLKAEDLNQFPNESIGEIMSFIQSNNPEAAIELINKSSMDILNTSFYFRLRKTTLLCEAALSKSPVIVKALIKRKVSMNPNFFLQEKDGSQENSETILKRLIWDNDFDSDSIPVGKLLVQNGADLLIKGFFDKVSILNQFYFDFMHQEKKHKKDFISSYQCMIEIMGDAFFEQLLFLGKNGHGNTELCSLKEDKNQTALYAFILSKTLAYLDKKEDTDDYVLAKFLLSTHQEEHVVEFVQSKLERRNKNKESSVDQSLIKHQGLISTNYSNSIIYANPAFSLFTHENEKNAFISTLNANPLSIAQIKRVHDVSIRPNEQQGKCWGATTTGIGIIGYDCSLEGFFELKKCAEKGWLNYHRYGNYFLRYIYTPKASDKQFDEIINNYNADMAKPHSRIDKLKRIIQLGSDITRFHYFCDANKRTSYIIFNSELVKHGFLPSVLNERLAFRVKSQKELLPLVLEGMEKCKNELLGPAERAQAEADKAAAELAKAQAEREAAERARAQAEKEAAAERARAQAEADKAAAEQARAQAAREAAAEQARAQAEREATAVPAPAVLIPPASDPSRSRRTLSIIVAIASFTAVTFSFFMMYPLKYQMVANVINTATGVALALVVAGIAYSVARFAYNKIINPGVVQRANLEALRGEAEEDRRRAQARNLANRAAEVVRLGNLANSNDAANDPAPRNNIFGPTWGRERNVTPASRPTQEKNSADSSAQGDFRPRI